MATILNFSGIRLYRAETLEEADFLLTVTGATVLLTDVMFLDGTWRDALLMAAETHPLAAVAITADTVDAPLLEDAGTRGACMILWKPLDLNRAIEWIRTLDRVSGDRAEWSAERRWAGAAKASPVR